MLTNPGKKPVKTYRSTSGLIKRDINLMPASRNAEKTKRFLAIAAGVLAGLLVLGGLLILVPSWYLKGKQQQAEQMQSQADKLAPADKEVNDLIAERNALTDMVTGLSRSVTNSLQPADLFSQLSAVCPGSITLTAVTQDTSGLTLEGFASSDSDVAQFIESLRSIAVFSNVELSSVQQRDNTLKSGQPRMFEIKCLLPEATASPSPAATPAPTGTAKGGAGK